MSWECKRSETNYFFLPIILKVPILRLRIS